MTTAAVTCLSQPRRIVVWIWGSATAALFGLYLLHLGLGLGAPALNRVANTWIYDVLELSAALGCFLRAVWVRSERVAWSILALSILSFAIGDLCFDFVYNGNPPTPSLADGFYLVFYPGCYAALLLLIKSRISTLNRGVWLDGLIAALASSAIASAFLIQVVLDHTGGRAITVIVDLAYPVGDVLLLGLVVFAFALTGWRPGREWAVLGAGFVAITTADSVYLALQATNSYAEGTLLDALWPGALLLLAASAWRRRDREHALDLEGRLLGAVPLAFGLAALGLLVIDNRLRHLNLFAVVLSAATVLTVFARTGLSLRENARLLERTREQSLTDALTALGNRRKLMSDLERELDRETVRPLLLVILDLNGFKRYNDTFGHPSGDALLARLGSKLASAVAPDGTAYRLGGDEFCLLVPYPGEDAEAVIDAATAALSDEGEGFTVGASFGAAVLPEEARDASEALRLVDERLYVQKATNVNGRGEPYEVLLRALSEREPSLGEHVRGVGELSVAIGARLGLGESAIRDLKLAAELHDVGKLAIPDAVLQKPGPLTPEEWEFITRHALIGQRILAGAPGLNEIGEIVRSTHERWDGTGYVDGLSGGEIPRAARIIAVADAYLAMISDRPYRDAMSSEAAIAEIQACAGSQFDPEVVAQFVELIHERVAAAGADSVLARGR